jgi:hypothetical protein
VPATEKLMVVDPLPDVLVGVMNASDCSCQRQPPGAVTLTWSPPPAIGTLALAGESAYEQPDDDPPTSIVCSLDTPLVPHPFWLRSRAK